MVVFRDCAMQVISKEDILANLGCLGLCSSQHYCLGDLRPRSALFFYFTIMFRFAGEVGAGLCFDSFLPLSKLVSEFVVILFQQRSRR